MKLLRNQNKKRILPLGRVLSEPTINLESSSQGSPWQGVQNNTVSQFKEARPPWKAQRCKRYKLLTGCQCRFGPVTWLLLIFSLEILIINSKFSLSPKTHNVLKLFAMCIQFCFNSLLTLHIYFQSTEINPELCAYLIDLHGGAPP